MRIVPWHLIFTPQTLAKFVEQLVQGPPGLIDMHEEIFSGRPDPVEAWLIELDLCGNVRAVEGPDVCPVPGSTA